ncbi:MAG: crosslink repair DNA glycosylase YcaQ family protein, partial [Caldimonas sp.]
AGDLERAYTRLKIDEDCLVNYGFLPRRHLALMHPRVAKRVWTPAMKKKAGDVLAFVREHGPTHPRLVDQQFAHGRTTNAWGGSSNATTHLLDDMHYRGLLRIKRRDKGIRIYEAADHPPIDNSARARAERAAALVELIVRKYAPLPASSFVHLVYLLGYGAPHLGAETRAALAGARDSLASTRIDGVTWYWPADENPRSSRHAPDARVRLLAPFDPIVWDRRRFELLWGWAYRFEAYTPAPKRTLGYYALPLLWQERVVGWGNASARDGRLQLEVRYANGSIREPDFRRELGEERERLREFLGV